MNDLTNPFVLVIIVLALVAGHFINNYIEKHKKTAKNVK
jgi:general stress protein CsbA